MRHRKVQCDETVYQIREVPASLWRKHTDLSTGEAQIDMLGLCVLGEDGKPLRDAVDDVIPMRHMGQLIDAISELSGFAEGNADAPAIAITS